MDKATLMSVSKAIAGGIAAGLTAAATALTDGVVTPVEWIAIALAVLAGSGLVYAAPANVPKQKA